MKKTIDTLAFSEIIGVQIIYNTQFVKLTIHKLLDLITYIIILQDPVTGSKVVTPFRSFDNSRQAIIKAPVRHKSMLSAFFVKQKTPKLRTGKVA